MQQLVLLFFIGLSVIPAQAQDIFFVGRLRSVVDSTLLSGAQVTLANPALDLPIGAISDQRGRFRIGPLQPGAYTLEIKATGFAPIKKSISLPEDNSLTLFLDKAYNLEAVDIEAEAPPAQQKGDTTEYNATAFTTNPDASTEDLVQKMPGVIMNNGKIEAQGEQVQQVLVDGKPFFGNDPSAALKNLPAEVVDKIQVFDQQSEQAQQTGFDDGNTTKTLNIVTKIEKRNGTFGRGYAGYGYEEKYKVGGNLNHFKGNLRLSIVGLSNNINIQNFAQEDLLGVASSGGNRRGGFGGRGRGGGGGSVGEFLVNDQTGIATTHAGGINYSNSWGKDLELSGSYFYNRSSNIADQVLTQQYFIGEEATQLYAEGQSSTTVNTNHRVNMRLSYDLDSKTNIRFSPRFTWQINNGNSLTLGETSSPAGVLSTTSNLFGSDLMALNGTARVNLNRRFSKRMRSLSLRVNANVTQQNGDNTLNSFFNTLLPPLSQDTIDQIGLLDAQGVKWSTNIRYTEPLNRKRTMMLQLGYEYNPQFDGSDQETYGYSLVLDDYDRLDSLLSNSFRYTYTAQAVNGGIMFRKGKTFFLTRLAVQYAQQENQNIFPSIDTIQNSFTNLLPFAIFRHRGKQKQIFGLYRTSTTNPTASQLTTAIDNSNVLQLSAGNPALDQSYDHMLMMRYSATRTEKGEVFYALVRGQLTQNYIGQEAIIARRDSFLSKGVILPQGGQLTRPTNLDGRWQFNSFLTYGKLVEAIKTNVNLSLTGRYTRTPGLINGQVNYANQRTAGVNLTLSSNISENVDFTIASQTDLNDVVNTIQLNADNQYLQQTTSGRLNLIFPGQIVFRSSLAHQLYRGLSEEFNQDYWLWNLGLAKKFLKNQQAELELSVFDVLQQNTSINRTVTEVYIQDLQTTVLQRYLMLTFTYNLRQFKGIENTPKPPEGFGPGFGRPGGGPGGERRN